MTEGRSSSSPSSLRRISGRLAVEAVLVEVADQELADPAPALRDRLEGELPQEVILQAFGQGQGAFDELAPGVACRLGVRPGVPGVRGVVEEVSVSVALLAGREGVQRHRGTVLLHLQGGVLLQLLLDGRAQILQGQGHEPDRLVELGGHLELLDLSENGSLGLHESSLTDCEAR